MASWFQQVTAAAGYLDGYGTNRTDEELYGHRPVDVDVETADDGHGPAAAAAEFVHTGHRGDEYDNHARGIPADSTDHSGDVVIPSPHVVTRPHRNCKAELCRVEGCDKNAGYGICNGMCVAHFNQANPDLPPYGKKFCKVEGCGKIARYEHMCMSHFKMYEQRGGEAEAQALDEVTVNQPAQSGAVGGEGEVEVRDVESIMAELRSLRAEAAKLESATATAKEPDLEAAKLETTTGTVDANAEARAEAEADEAAKLGTTTTTAIVNADAGADADVDGPEENRERDGRKESEKTMESLGVETATATANEAKPTQERSKKDPKKDKKGYYHNLSPEKKAQRMEYNRLYSKQYRQRKREREYESRRGATRAARGSADHWGHRPRKKAMTMASPSSASAFALAATAAHSPELALIGMLDSDTANLVVRAEAAHGPAVLDRILEFGRGLAEHTVALEALSQAGGDAAAAAAAAGASSPAAANRAFGDDVEEDDDGEDECEEVEDEDDDDDEVVIRISGDAAPNYSDDDDLEDKGGGGSKGKGRPKAAFDGPTTCTVEGCETRLGHGPGSTSRLSRGLCTAHLQGRRKRPTCLIENCGKTSQGWKCGGMCVRHFKHAESLGVLDEDEVGINAAIRAAGGGSVDDDTKTKGKSKYRQYQKLCTVDGCGKNSRGKLCMWMCREHFAEKYPDGCTE